MGVHGGRIRYWAALAAGLVQVALFALFALPSHWGEGKDRAPKAVAMVLSFFEPEEIQRGAPLPSAAPPIQHLATPPLQIPPLAPENAITAPVETAPIDWTEEARHASETALSRQDRERERRSFDLPKGMAPPPRQQGHVYGDVERFEGGETITWVNSRCYYTSRAIADFAANTGPGPPPMQRKICKR